MFLDGHSMLKLHFKEGYQLLESHKTIIYPRLNLTLTPRVFSSQVIVGTWGQMVHNCKMVVKGLGFKSWVRH